VRLPISDGIDPVRELMWRPSLVMAVRLPISDGIDPVREFMANEKCCTFAMPDRSGIVPA
jgi:hypothetical protein